MYRMTERCFVFFPTFRYECSGLVMKKRGKRATRVRGRKRASVGSLKRVNWDAISDRRLIKVTALVIREDVTADEGIREFQDCVIIARKIYR